MPKKTYALGENRHIVQGESLCFMRFREHKKA